MILASKWGFPAEGEYNLLVTIGVKYTVTFNAWIYTCDVHDIVVLNFDSPSAITLHVQGGASLGYLEDWDFSSSVITRCAKGSEGGANSRENPH